MSTNRNLRRARSGFFTLCIIMDAFTATHLATLVAVVCYSTGRKSAASSLFRKLLPLGKWIFTFHPLDISVYRCHDAFTTVTKRLYWIQTATPVPRKKCLSNSFILKKYLQHYSYWEGFLNFIPSLCFFSNYSKNSQKLPRSRALSTWYSSETVNRTHSKQVTRRYQSVTHVP